MAGKKIKPKIKPIDKDATIYHHYEYDVANFGLFDDADDGTPVVVGSRNLVDATIRKLSKSIVIFYYKKNPKGFWEKKFIHEGKKRETQ